MITGFNTNVDYEGRVFHVQTEDKGQGNPVVETLVYSGGEIVTSRRSSYGDLLNSAEYSEDEVMRRMEVQHQTIIREIMSGQYDPEGPKPFGYNIISNRSLDEVVLEYLEERFGSAQILLQMESEASPEEGSGFATRLRVVAAGSEQPVGGAKVTIRLLSTSRPRTDLFSGTTDKEGWVEASFDIPTVEGNAAVVYQAEAAGFNAEIKQPVGKSGSPAGR